MSHHYAPLTCIRWMIFQLELVNSFIDHRWTSILGGHHIIRLSNGNYDVVWGQDTLVPESLHCKPSWETQEDRREQPHLVLVTVDSLYQLNLNWFRTLSTCSLLGCFSCTTLCPAEELFPYPLYLGTPISTLSLQEPSLVLVLGLQSWPTLSKSLAAFQDVLPPTAKQTHWNRKACFRWRPQKDQIVSP